MNTIQLAPLPKEKPFETVNRAWKNAQVNNKNVTINIYGEKFLVKSLDTLDDLTTLKATLNTMSKLQDIKGKLSAKV